MFRKLSDTFSATHLVLMFAIAVLAPSGLYAAANFSNVAVVDPYGGGSAQIDSSRRLRVYDQAAGFTSNPFFAVNLSQVDSGSAGTNIYTVPSGKVLIITSIEWSYYGNTAGNFAYAYLSSNSNYIYSADGEQLAENISPNLNPGLIVRAGTLTLETAGPNSRTYIQGYLVPDTAVPPPSSPEAAQQFVLSSHAIAGQKPQ